MKRFLRNLLIVLVCLAAIYFVGPHPTKPVYSATLPAVPAEGPALEQYIHNKESQHRLKPDNEARIVWADSPYHITPYAVVYLHGFSASQEEGDSIHRDFARRYGCNMYLSRLDGHGVDTSEPLLTMTADGLWNDAKEALQIGKALGQKVILMGTSTGGTLAIKLAATYPQDVYAVINMSPNIAINDNLAFLANGPWGLQLARLVQGGKYKESVDTSKLRSQYWFNKYRLEAVVQLQNLVSTSMTPATFAKVHQPALNLYYYKDEEHQDPTVRVSAILEMGRELGTADSLKMAVPIPGAGSHVMGCWLTGHDLPAVANAVNTFADSVLRMNRVH